MQTEYLNKRELKIPDKGPKALRTLLRETEEGLKREPGLDTVRLLHDSLVFLTEFFASFAAGALKTVGPYSVGIQQLMSQPVSLDRAERLLAQAFLDWKAYPHHPAYESLRDAFYLSSRLQSSRFAPRRHTRWLGVEGRAVAGLERLTRWSRRIDLAVIGNDTSSAKGFIESYTPILWSWTDSLDRFFEGWSIDVSTGIDEGTLSLSGSASRDDVRLDLVPVQRLSGLKSVFATDGNGGVQLKGFIVPMAMFGGESAEGQPAVAPPAEAAVKGEELSAQLVFDPVSGEYKSPPAVSIEESPSATSSSQGASVESLPETSSVSSSLEENVGTPLESSSGTDVPLFASPLSELNIGVPEVASTPTEPFEASGELMELPGPDELPDFVDIKPQEENQGALSEDLNLSIPMPSKADPMLPDLSEPIVSDLTGPSAAVDRPESEAEPVPDLREVTGPTPSHEDPMLPDLTSPALPDFATPEATSAQPEIEPVQAPPDLTAPSMGAAEVAVPDFTAPSASPSEVAVPDFTASSMGALEATVPDFTEPPASALESEVPELSAPSTADPDPVLPDLSAPAAPDFSAPEAPAAQPEVVAEPEPELPDLAAPSTSPSEAVVPDFTAPSMGALEATVPDFTEPAASELESEVPELSSPSIADPDPVLPDLSAPADPDFSAPEAPAAQPEVVAEPEPELPEFTASSASPSEVAVPDFTAPSMSPSEATVPDFTEPPASELESEVPELSAPSTADPDPVLPNLSAPADPDFSAPEAPAAQPEVVAEPEPELPEFTASSASPSEVAVPDFTAPSMSPSEVAVPDFTAPSMSPSEATVPDFTEPAASELESGPSDFSDSEPLLIQPQSLAESEQFLQSRPIEESLEILSPDALDELDLQPETSEAASWESPGEPLSVVDPEPAGESVESIPAVTESFPSVDVSTQEPQFEEAIPGSAEEFASLEPSVAGAVPGLDISGEAGTQSDQVPLLVESQELPVSDPSVPEAPKEDAGPPAAAESHVFVSAELPAAVPESLPSIPDFSTPAGQADLQNFSSPFHGVPVSAESPETTLPVSPIPELSSPVGDMTGFGPPTPGSSSEESLEQPSRAIPTQESSLETDLPEQTVEVQLPVEPEVRPAAVGESGEGGSLAHSAPSTETSSPEFASPSIPTELSSSPFVAGSMQFQSVEMVSSIGSARDMGASAEEILDDNYEFSSEDGPSAPKWTGWNVDQRETVQQLCETLAVRAASAIPSVYATFLQSALTSGATKIQVVIERACGKSRLASDLALSLAESDSMVAILASWDRSRDEDQASSQLLRFYNELVRNKKTQRGQLALPEPESVTDLAVAADREGFEIAFQRLLGQIATINRREVIFFLDEPPAAIRQAMGRVNLSGLRFVSFVNPGDQSDELGQMLDLRGKWKQAAVELFGSQVAPYCEKTGANLLRVALLKELLNTNSPAPEDMSRVEEAVAENPVVSKDLLAVLGLEESPVSLDDLDQWFLEADEVSKALTAFPSLFEIAKTRLSPVIGITHPTVLRLVEEKYERARVRAARKLLGWAVAQLEKTNPEKYGGLQVREIVFRNFVRLYRFAQLSADSKILEWVMRNKELQRRRVALYSQLEKPGSRYELQSLQELVVGLLTKLVESGRCDDLRDELAWARSNLALNQLKLGQLPQAAEEISAASKLFETLVIKEKQYEFRPALSTANYRASRIYSAQGNLAAATDYANQAVAGFVDLVEDRGRTELTPRLGVALAHRGSLYWDVQKSDAAKADLERAARLLDGADTGDVQESFRTQIDIHLELVSIYTKEGDFEAAVRESGKAVQLATVAVEERGLDDFQPTLATCHAIRAKTYFKQREQDRALRDIAKSISLRNLSVDEGRLEQRFLLSKDLQLRAQILQTKGSDEDASRDLNRAVELLQSLHAEGRLDALAPLLSCLLERALLSLKRGQVEVGIVDLTTGLALAGDGPEMGETRLKLLDTLLQAHLQSGNVIEALNVSQGLLAQYHAAQAWEPYSRVQLVRGEALERTGQHAQALECYTQASNLLSQLLARGQTDELLGRVAEAYLGIGSVETTLGRPANGAPQVKRAIDVFTHLFQQRQSPAALPRLLKAYSVYAGIHLSGERLGEAMQALKSGFDILGYMEAQGGKGGVPTTKGMEKLKGEMFRLRARVLLSGGDAQNALNDVEEASRNFLLTRQQPGGANWKDELGRTWTLRSKILFSLKDFGQAESSIQDAIGHFEERLGEGRYEYFPDLMHSLTVRAENSSRSGKIDQVLEEYNRMLAIIAGVAKSGAKIDHEREMAKVLERRAKVYRDQGLLNEAYADYESVIGLYRTLVTQKGRAELAEELVRIHLERAQMTTKAGHAQYAINDLGEAVNVSKVLVSQGQMGAVPQLATALHRRAEIFKTLNRPAEALTDLEGAIGFRSQLAQQSKDPDQIAELGKSFLLQGTLLAAAGRGGAAAQSLDQSNGIFTSLVEQQGRKEFSSELAQGLIQRVSLSSDRSDPSLRQVLIKAVDLVAKQAKEGKPIAKDFTVECLRTVVELLQREDYDTVGALIDSVLNLVEFVVTDGKSEQDFVKLTDLLLAASAGLIDDRRTARRPHFLSLACVSCNREIQMFGKNSLPRLVYCLYELGQALERSKAPAVLNYVGSSFALLGELARQQEANEDFLRELKMMVSTWRSLPPQIPALANVSRHMLSQLLRLT